MNKKSNSQIIWPSSQTFTLQDVFLMNPKDKQITLRSKVTKEKENGKVVELGSLPRGDMGRPIKMYAYSPITPAIVEKAKASNVLFADGFESKYCSNNV